MSTPPPPPEESEPDVTASTAPPGETTTPPAVQAARDAKLADRSQLWTQAQIAEETGRHPSTIRVMYGQTVRALNAETPLTNTCLPAPDRYLDPDRKRYPRWWPATIYRWALGEDPSMPAGYPHRLAWAAPDSAELVPVREFRGAEPGHPGEIPVAFVKRRAAARDQVVEEYRRQLKISPWTVRARRETARALGLTQERVKRLLIDAAHMPEVYGKLPDTSPKAEHPRLVKLVVDMYRKARAAETKQRATHPKLKREVAQEIADEIGLARNTVLNLLNEAGVR